MLLVQLPHTDRFPSVFPIGISNIASALEEVGVESEVFDVFALGYSRADVTEHLRKREWDIIGISAFATQFPWAKWMVAEAKRLRPNRLVIMGGPLPTYNAELLIERTQTDVCVVSEGEETIKELVQNLGHLDTVNGICFRSETGHPVRTAARPYIRNLDEIPFTNYELFPMDVYFQHMGTTGVPNVKTINTLTSRGCPYNCSFCSRTFGGARFRSIDRLMEEIALLQDKYGIRGVTFSDELVLASKKRAYELCEKIRPLKVYWNCQGRANVVDLDLLRAMKASGCTSVGYGTESGSQRILDSMNKRVTVQQNELAIINTIKAGMIPVSQMIFGYPGEDIDTIRESVEFFARVKFYPPTARGDSHFNLLTPLPGSPLYLELCSQGRIENEEEYLLQLEHGYYIGSPLRINLTQFTDEELMEQKTWIEQQVKANYENFVRKHPAERFRKHSQVLSSVWTVEGLPGLRRLIGSRAGRYLERVYETSVGTLFGTQARAKQANSVKA